MGVSTPLSAPCRFFTGLRTRIQSFASSRSPHTCCMRGMVSLQKNGSCWWALDFAMFAFSAIPSDSARCTSQVDRSMSRIISILTFVLTIATTSNAGVELYVSPHGNDAGGGTAEEPFFTLARAREVIGKLTAGGLTTDVRVVIHGGTYCLDQPLVLGPKFSGTEQHSITFAAFPGETPVISAGRQVTGWTKGTGQVWTVFLPDVKLGKWNFRQPFVNGGPAVRARSPNFNDDPPYYSVSGAQLSEDNQNFQVALKTGRVHAWQNLSDVELVACGEFEILRKQIWRVNEAAATVYLNPPHVRGHPMTMPREKTRCYLENALEFLDQPGEW